MSVCPDCGEKTEGRNSYKLCKTCLQEHKRMSNRKSKMKKRIRDYESKRLHLRGKSFDEIRETISKKYERDNT